MVKRIFALALAVVMVFSAAGCAQEKPDGAVEAVVPTGEISAEQVNAGISTPGDGYYNVFVDMTVGFNEDGEISYAYLENPILLAFKVSEDWREGVYLYSGDEMAEMLETLNGIAETGNRKDKVTPKKEWVDKICEAADLTQMAVFMKDSLIPIVGEENMRREFPWDKERISRR